jgi:6-pyruvoyltetrahydropterin/6-carboxytetrahydropterin synthase
LEKKTRQAIKQSIRNISNYFSASHFLLDYGKCERLHGHDYKIECTLKYNKSNFIDFSIIKSIIRKLSKDLNQKILLPTKDKRIVIKKTEKNLYVTIHKRKEYSFPIQDSILLKVESVSCENLAQFFHKKVKDKILEIEKNNILLCITVSETKTNSAQYCDKI